MIEKLLKESKADNLIILSVDENSKNVRFANNSVTTSGSENSSSLIFISISGKKKGITSIEGGSIDDCIKSIRVSEEIANLSEDDPSFEELIDDKTISGDSLSFEDEANLDEKVSRILNSFNNEKVYGFGISKRFNISIHSTNGINKSFDGGYDMLGTTIKREGISLWKGIATDGTEQLNENSIIESINEDLNYPDKIIQMPAGEYEVILTPNAVADMAVYLMWMMSRREADEGRSPFSNFENGKLSGSITGKKIFPEYINISSDPFKKGQSSIPFVFTSSESSFASIYDNGMPLLPVNWVENGVLKNLITPRPYAKKHNLTPVYYPGNLIIGGSDKSRNTLIKNVKKGLLVSSLWYIRTVDPMTGLLTGLTRDGVFVIEDGEIVGRTNNFRFNMSPIQVFKNTLELSKSELTIPRESDETDTVYEMPYLRVDKFNMSSVSQAV